jgi:hypothetical protein
MSTALGCLGDLSPILRQLALTFSLGGRWPINMTTSVLAGKIAYIMIFTHFPLSRPTLHSLHSAEPHQPHHTLALSHTCMCTLTLHPLHIPDISTCLHLSHMLQSTFLHFSPLSHASPGVPLAPPVHIVPSLPTFPGLLSYTFSI